MLLCLRTASSGDGVDEDLCKRFVNCLLRLASRSFCTDNLSRERRGLVGGVAGESAVEMPLFTSPALSGDSVVLLPPLQQRPSSEGGGDGGRTSEKGASRTFAAMISPFLIFLLQFVEFDEYFLSG